MRLIRNLISGLTELVYPKTCHACKNRLGALSIDELICEDCWSKITKNLPPFCYCCGRSLIGRKFTRNVCISCLRQNLNFDRAFSPCVYDGVLKELIHAFKYHQKDYLGRTLAKLMINFTEEFNFPMDYMDAIIPIPLSASRMREREYNQAQILAAHIAKEHKKGLFTQTIQRQKNTRSQTELQDRQRAENVKGAFAIKDASSIKNKNILLIDDVLTSGATCSEAAGILKNAGANIVYVLTLAS